MLDHVEYFMEFGTSFSKLKIMRTAITYSTKKCGVLVQGEAEHLVFPEKGKRAKIYFGKGRFLAWKKGFSKNPCYKWDF